MKKEDFDKYIIVVLNQEELNEMFLNLNLEPQIIDFDFPVVVYKNRFEGVSINGIEKDNLDKLRKEKFNSKTVINYSTFKEYN